MNNMLVLSENIRTSTSSKLLRNISLESMHNSLVGLFVDRSKIDTTLARYFNEDAIKETLRYSNCLSLNDERTIAFHQNCRQSNYVFDEKRQIWVDGGVDTEKDDLFIPSGDAK